MPTYDYECPGGDGEVIEFALPFNHDKPRCEVCGAEMQQVYKAVPTHFKTDGFYSTGG